METSRQLIYPMAFYVFYIGGLIIYSLMCRLRAVKNDEVSGTYFKSYADKSLLPHKLIVLERHLDNQFQLPILFFVTGAIFLAINQINNITIGLAWGFVAFRLIHSYIHLGKNRVLQRAKAYGLAWLMIFSLWAQLVYLVS